MNKFMGIDTSNYTSSAAIFNAKGTATHNKFILPVPYGKLGLRQSEAVFAHVKNLPHIIQKTLLDQSNTSSQISAIGVSAYPCDNENSYMPCFLVGVSIAESISATLGINCHKFSHQAGHIMAALYSAKRMDLIKKDFLAFHVSGGTTEVVLVNPSEQNILKTKLVAKSLDLKAGQLIDRVGAMLGFPFPSGKFLDPLASYTKDVIPAKLKELNCCLSGAENICQKMLTEKKSPEEIASYCVTYIMKTLDAMCKKLLK